jgi:hypothetical protein
MNVELDIDERHYWEQCLDYLEATGRITCQNIQRITHTTNPQKVIQQLKEKGYIDEDREEWQSRNGKSWKIHYLKEQTELAL